MRLETTTLYYMLGVFVFVLVFITSVGLVARSIVSSCEMGDHLPERRLSASVLILAIGVVTGVFMLLLLSLPVIKDRVGEYQLLALVWLVVTSVLVVIAVFLAGKRDKGSTGNHGK